MSGSRLRVPQPLSDNMHVDGSPDPSFSFDLIRRIPAGDLTVKSFVLVDVHTGRPVHRPAG